MAPSNQSDLVIEITRALEPSDLPRLTNPSPVDSRPVPISQLRASHHQLAQLLATGRPANEISLVTGYSPSRISILQADPTFAELVASYTSIRSQIFADTLERMKVLGLSTLDELQERLETSPDKWSNRELMEMADLMLVKSTAPGRNLPFGPSGAAGNVGVAIQVQFVKSDTPALSADTPRVIEGKAISVKNSA